MDIRSKIEENKASILDKRPIVFFDMDGVLADFYGTVLDKKLLIREPTDKDTGWTELIDWDKFKGKDPEENMYRFLKPFDEMVSYARELKDKGYDVRVLTGLPRGLPAKDENGNIIYRRDGVTPKYDPCEKSRIAKRMWLDEHGLSDIPMSGCFAYEKTKYMTQNCILIDDKEANCEHWANSAKKHDKNGIAILHNINHPAASIDKVNSLLNSYYKEKEYKTDKEKEMAPSL